jgi:poly(3-hydroxybutyrate) depolymerase
MVRTISVVFAGLAAVGLLFSAAQAAEQQTTLADLGKKLKLDSAQISVSGVSSGGFMAHQFHVAHSKDIIGSGVIAGGPYYCAKGDYMRGLTVCTAFALEGMCLGLDFCKSAARPLYQGPGPAPCGTSASDEALAMAKESVDATLGQSFDLDDPTGMIGDRVMIIHGTNDTLLPVGVSDALYEYFPLLYQRLGQSLPENTVVYLKDLPAPHAVVTDNPLGLDPIREQINACDRFGSPFVNVCGPAECAAGCAQSCQVCGDATGTCNASCNTSCQRSRDNAGRILEHIHGPLAPRTDPAIAGVKQYTPKTWPTVNNDCKAGAVTDSRCEWLQQRLMAFLQKEAFGNNPNDTVDAVMADKAYIFVPPQCLDGTTPCKLHVAFHGCRQGYGYAGQEPDGRLVKKALYGAPATEPEKQLAGWTYFVENAGYNEWADTNNIVVLYPQATARLSSLSPFEWIFPGMYMQHVNGEGCWDFWGYTNQDDYNTKNGQQIAAVWRMIETLLPAELR